MNYKNAIETLYQDYSNMVFRTCLRVCHDEELAEDLTHEIFANLLKKDIDLDSINSLFSWLYRIAINKAIDNTRKTKRRKNLWDQNEIFIEEFNAEYDNNNNSHNIYELFSEETKDLKETLVLYFCEGLQQDEVAKVMNISRSGVSKRITNWASKQRDKKDLVDKLRGL